MEEIIKKELEKDEQLLYIGKPQQSKLLDKTNKTAFIAKNLIIFVLVAALCIGYGVYCASSGSQSRSGVYVVLAFIFIVSVYTGISDLNALNKKTGYGLSNKRLFVVRDESVYTLEYEKIPCVKLAKDEDGFESLLFGKKGIKLRPSVWRKAAMSNHLVESEANVCEEFVMYKPENPEKVREIAGKYLTVM